MEDKPEGILVLADRDYVSIPPDGKGDRTKRCGLEVRYIDSINPGLYAEEYPIRIVAVVDALRSSKSELCLKDLLLSHIPLLIVVASTTNLYDKVYRDLTQEAGIPSMDAPPGRPANLLRLVPSNAAQAWAISSWLRHHLAGSARVAVVHAQHEQSGRAGVGDKVYVEDLSVQLHHALEGHGFTMVTARQWGDSLLLSRHDRSPEKLDALVCASYPPRRPRKFLKVLAGCTDLLILPDAWEPVRTAAIAGTEIWKVFVARSPELRLKDAIRSIDEALFEDPRTKDRGLAGRFTLPGGRAERARPRDSLLLRIQHQLERIVPPAYRFEGGWQNMGFGYELVRMEH